MTIRSALAAVTRTLVDNFYAGLAYWGDAVAESLSPLDSRARSYLTMDGADCLNAAEERVEALDPWFSDGGPTEWLGQAHESSAGTVQPAPADEAPDPSLPPDKAADPGQPKGIRVVSVLGPDERDAVWQCQELAPTRAWNALYRWNPHYGWWEYNKHGYWAQSSAGARDLTALTINPVKSDGLVVEFTEIHDDPDFLGSGDERQDLIDEMAGVMCTAFASLLLRNLGDNTVSAQGFWDEGIDESGRELWRDQARAVLDQFEVSRK